jgi:hypothetical protein
MIFAPTAGSYGFQVHGSVCRMKNAESSAALAVGDVVITAHAANAYTFPPTTEAQALASPFYNVIKAEGDQALHNGFIGVVVDVGQFAGAAGTEVLVQFGGTALAKVTAAAAVSRGTKLVVSDTAGEFDTGGGATGTVCAAVALAPLASGTANIQVLLQPGLYCPAVV